MKAVITTSMCVVGDNKSAVRFEPLPPIIHLLKFLIRSTHVSSAPMLQNLLLTSKQQQNLKRQLNKLSK